MDAAAPAGLCSCGSDFEQVPASDRIRSWNALLLVTQARENRQQFGLKWRRPQPYVLVKGHAPAMFQVEVNSWKRFTAYFEAIVALGGVTVGGLGL